MSDGVDESGRDPAELLADLLYTAVGLAILAVNRLQLARRGLQCQLGDGGVAGAATPGLGAVEELFADPERASRLISTVQREIRDLDDRLGGVEQRVAGVLDTIEPDLPESLQGLSKAVRDLATEHGHHIRTLLGLPAPSASEATTAPEDPAAGPQGPPDPTAGSGNPAGDPPAATAAGGAGASPERSRAGSGPRPGNEHGGRGRGPARE